MKINLVVSSLLLMAMSLVAQVAPNGNLAKPKKSKAVTQEERVKRKSNWLKTNLGLSDEQVTKVEASIAKRNNAIKMVREKVGKNKEAFKKEMTPYRKQFNAEMKSILSAEQFSKLKEMRKAKRQTKKDVKTKSKTNNDVEILDEIELDLDEK